MYSLSLIGRGSCCFRPPPPGATLERLQPRGRCAQLCVGGCGITRAFLLPYATRPSLGTPIPASRSEEGCGHAGVASPATHRRAPRPSVVDRGHRRALGGSQRRPAGQRPTVVGATQRDPGQAAAIRLRAKRHRVGGPHGEELLKLGARFTFRVFHPKDVATSARTVTLGADKRSPNVSLLRLTYLLAFLLSY